MTFTQLRYPYEKYSISKNGVVMNNKTKHILNHWIHHRHGYYYYTLRNSELNDKRNLSLHRLLGLTFIPNPLKYKCIDHIDRNRKNNNINNLRWVSHQMNSINKDCNNPLGRGITKSRNGEKYNVNLWRNYKKKFIGVFDTNEEAKIAYRHAVEEWHINNITTETTPLSPEI